MSSALNLLTGLKYVEKPPSEAAKAFKTPKPYHGFSKLQVGNHEIFSFRFVKNKLYNKYPENPGLERSLLIELKDQVLFLPEYIGSQFDDAQIEELNNDGITKYMFFGGSRPNRLVQTIIKNKIKITFFMIVCIFLVPGSSNSRPVNK